jgi:hypothetical protein
MASFASQEPEDVFNALEERSANFHIWRESPPGAGT